MNVLISTHKMNTYEVNDGMNEFVYMRKYNLGNVTINF